MRRPALVVVPLLLIAALGGCAVPSTDDPNPLHDLIDIIPWAKSVASDASANELTARIAEVSAGLPSLDVAGATRTQIEVRLKTLDAAIRADPSNGVAHAAELNAILADVKDALA